MTANYQCCSIKISAEFLNCFHMLGITSIYAAYGNRNILEERTARAEYTIYAFRGNYIFGNPIVG